MSDHSHMGTHSYVEEALTITPALRNADLVDSWERIVVSQQIKQRLLNHALLAIELRTLGLGGTRAPMHGLVLLAGPPGVGKTSLARGLASQVAEELSDHHGVVRLVDVNMHILPSELLGRTQRNIVQLFEEELPALAEQGPIIVVLDEMEVLAVSRSQASMEINPADVFRGTAALLSALDWISRQVPGAFVVGTTNLPDALDDAVTSRVDLILRFPHLTPGVIREILADTLNYLGELFTNCRAIAESEKLEEVALLLDGRDGRQIRKFVMDVLTTDREIVRNPNLLTIDTLLSEASRSALIGAE